MNVEETGLAGRVARYAALADPVRLRIVDLLTLGDVAPVELQGELGISSSLLAHHLNLLERERLIVRTRSQADRRRTYLHLTPGVLDHLISSPTLGVRRVVFVCTGNSARSQLAAALWHHTSTVPVASAGTHPTHAIEPGAIAAADRHGLTLLALAPQSLDEMLDVDDFVITVCDAAHEELGSVGRVHWSVPDPVRDGSDAAFDAAFENIAARIHTVASRLTTA
jgi:protein-tyrosine-phosphatase/DNA-binding transcriptional ArsR family regulator